jgi:hypothetical protein
MINLPASAAAVQSTSASRLSLKISEVIAISVSSPCDSASYAGNDVTLSLDPQAGGVLSTCPNVVTVSTNTTGFQLSFKSSGANMIHTTNSSYTIPPTANTVPNTLAANTWGYAVPASDSANHSTVGIPSAITSAFDSSYANRVDATPIPTDKYAKAPTTDATIKDLDITDSGASMQNNKTTVYYGVAANLATTAGAYKTTITYTAIGEEVPPVPELACVSGDQFKGYLGAMQNNTFSSLSAVGDTGIAVDSRNDQQYCVGRLADEHIWMLNNLKIDNLTVDSTNADLNTESNTYISDDGSKLAFSIPGKIASTLISSDDPIVYGPIPVTTGPCVGNVDGYDDADINSECFGGYLYNWSAATAGESTTTMPASSGDAPNSICPANWRLPIGDPTDGDFYELYDVYSNDLDDFLFSGPFRGTFAGRVSSGYFNSQGEIAAFWSATGSSYDTDDAFNMSFDSHYVAVDLSSNSRAHGFAVRCILR